ncbi:MAG TPA: XrtA/PEP-CTERM system-associated ATPase [Burkholderiales bacterium]|nr:XrtA/PEP-CTERM system-associated ATPase [Burkholderiales bacterium]
MFDEFYGFSGQPFQLNPDPAFFYGSRGHKRAYAYLQYGLYQGEGFIALTGEVGAGKTTLIRSLLQELSAKNVVAAQLVSTQLDADNLLRAVATAFGLAVREHDKARILAELEAYLVSLVPQNERALLIVDEAQNLTPRAMEELRMLSNFQLQNRALLQSFLVGQPELRQLMRSPGMRQLRQRVIASYHLGPLDSDETRAYIEHRLKQVGWQGDPAFEEEVFAVVHAYTGGIPRRINTVCTRALLAAFLSEKHLIGVEDMEQVMGELAEELGESAGAAASAGGADDPAGLEDRISGVEKAMAMTVKLLREVIRTRERSEPDPPEKAP